MSQFCVKCGKELEEGAVFCHSCGSRVADENDGSLWNNTNVNYYQNDFSENRVKHGNKSLVFLLSALVLIIIGVPILCYFSFRSTPEKTIRKFESSYNNLDTDGMLDCLEPDAQAIFKGTTALLSGLTGFDVNDVFEGVIGYMGYSDSDTQPQVHFKILNIDYSSKTSAQAEVSCSYFDGEEYDDSTETLPMVKINGKWYIAVLDSMFY